MVVRKQSEREILSPRSSNFEAFIREDRHIVVVFKEMKAIMNNKFWFSKIRSVVIGLCTSSYREKKSLTS